MMFDKPNPKYVEATTFAVGETVNLQIKSKESGLVFWAKYLTLQSTQDVTIRFNDAETDEFYTATETDAMDGSSATHQVAANVYIPANTKMTFRGTFGKITSITAATPGSLHVWAEYDG